MAATVEVSKELPDEAMCDAVRPIRRPDEVAGLLLIWTAASCAPPDYCVLSSVQKYHSR